MQINEFSAVYHFIIIVLLVITAIIAIETGTRSLEAMKGIGILDYA